MSLTHQALLFEEKPGTLRFGGARIALLDVQASFWGLRRQLEALVGRRLTDAVLQQAGTNGGAAMARALVGDDVADDAQALRDCVAAYQAAGFGRFEIEVLEWPIGRALIRGTDTFEAWMMRQHGQKADAPACAYTAGVLVGFVNALGGRQDVVCIKRACQTQGAEACLFELLPADRAAGTPIIALDPDPFLSQQLNLLEILFDRMPMGVAIFDRDLVLRRFNPTWADFIDHHTPSMANQVVPGARFFDLAPGIETAVMPIFQRVLAGETVRQEALRLESGGIVSYWDVVFAPLVEAGKVAGVVSVITDATERQRANEALRRQHGQLRALAAALAEAEEVERRQLARELHDRVGQNLTALGINLNVLQALIPPTLPSADRIRARLDDSLALVEQTAERIRDVMASLRPAVLDDYGLRAALEWYGAQFAARTSLSTTVQGEEPDPRLASRVENALFRIAQEALTNVAKHAQATEVTVTVEVDGDTVRLVVADDGIGFDPSRVNETGRRQGWGLLTMTERAGAVGGRCHVESHPQQGTQVVVEVWR
jgi:signal transduction histidine kinase